MYAALRFSKTAPFDSPKRLLSQTLRKAFPNAANISRKDAQNPLNYLRILQLKSRHGALDRVIGREPERSVLLVREHRIADKLLWPATRATFQSEYTFRNRIAHHEPIFARHLEQDYKNILEISGWISPQKRHWIETHSRVPEMLATPRYSRDIRF
jgi:hypothetical protein